MDDDELVRIATFKLRDLATRMIKLASEAQSPEVRSTLMSIAEAIRVLELRAHEPAEAILRHADIG